VLPGEGKDKQVTTYATKTRRFLRRKEGGNLLKVLKGNLGEVRVTSTFGESDALLRWGGEKGKEGSWFTIMHGDASKGGA